MTWRREEDLDRMAQPDIEIGAVVSAKKLRFNSKPKTEVRIEGEPGVDEVSGSARENLPDTVEPGVTYRDVRVKWRAAARLDSAKQDRRERGDDGQK